MGSRPCRRKGPSPEGVRTARHCQCTRACTPLLRHCSSSPGKHKPRTTSSCLQGHRRPMLAPSRHYCTLPPHLCILLHWGLPLPPLPTLCRAAGARRVLLPAVGQAVVHHQHRLPIFPVFQHQTSNAGRHHAHCALGAQLLGCRPSGSTTRARPACSSRWGGMRTNAKRIGITQIYVSLSRAAAAAAANDMCLGHCLSSVQCSQAAGRHLQRPALSPITCPHGLKPMLHIWAGTAINAHHQCLAGSLTNAPTDALTRRLAQPRLAPWPRLNPRLNPARPRTCCLQAGRPHRQRRRQA